MRRQVGRITGAALAACFSVAAAQAPALERRAPVVPPLEVPEGGVEVPFELVADQPAIEVRIAGQGPYRFLLDTGAAGGGRVSADLARRLGLETVATVRAGDPSGRNAEDRPLVRVPELTVGGATVRGVDMLLAPEGPAVEEFDGILGFPLFRDGLLTLDYPARRLTFRRGDLPPADGRDVLECSTERGIPVVTIDVAGRSLQADVDSGSMGRLLLPESVVADLTLAGAPRVVGRARTAFNEFEIKQATLAGSVTIGSHVLREPSIEFADMFPRANLGGQFLSEFAVTFDQRNGRIRFRRDDTVAIERAPRFRVGVMFGVGSHDGLRIEDVVPGAPGERAGLQAGDVVESINGVPVTVPVGRELLDVFGRPDPVRVVVRRGNESVTVTVSPEPAD